MKSYRELKKLKTFLDRFEYLKIGGKIGQSTFGGDRWINQAFYTSKEWRRTRNGIILRDNGCDLGVEGYDILRNLVIHHINPVTIEDLEERRDIALDPDNLVCVSDITHKAIHYGDASLLPKEPVERKPNDTCPWR